MWFEFKYRRLGREFDEYKQKSITQSSRTITNKSKNKPKLIKKLSSKLGKAKSKIGSRNINSPEATLSVNSSVIGNNRRI